MSCSALIYEFVTSSQRLFLHFAFNKGDDFYGKVIRIFYGTFYVFPLLHFELFTL